MPKTVRITCDTPGCGRDLTCTTNAEDYRLVLDWQSVGHAAGVQFVTAMHVIKPSSEAKYFCGLPCLTQWLDIFARGDPTPSDSAARAANRELMKFFTTMIQRIDEGNPPPNPATLKAACEETIRRAALAGAST